MHLLDSKEDRIKKHFFKFTKWNLTYAGRTIGKHAARRI